MFDGIRKNLEHEKRIIREARFIRKALLVEEEKKGLYARSIRALLKQINLLNRTIPHLLQENFPVQTPRKSAQVVSHAKVVSAPKKVPKKKTVEVEYTSPVTKEKHFITLNSGDKKAYLEQLKLSQENLRSIKKIDFQQGKAIITKANPYARISNKFFRNYSEKLLPSFQSLSADLKKGNIRFLLSTYISMALFSTSLAFLLGTIVFVVLLFIDLGNFIHVWLPILLPSITFTLFYIYPASEASSVQKKIGQELPFATIHMAAIAGSDIEPTKIFKIIASSKEYPAVGTEIRKIIAQVDLYGYDLVTSLKNVSKWTPNKKLAELFSGFATNIYTGGELKNFLEKKAENFLLDYRLERKRYTELAGTFMDIYISILIAAPLILMMMFIVMNVAGLGLGGFGIPTLMAISIGAIILVNILFLIVLNLKQPKV